MGARVYAGVRLFKVCVHGDGSKERDFETLEEVIARAKELVDEENSKVCK